MGDDVRETVRCTSLTTHFLLLLCFPVASCSGEKEGRARLWNCQELCCDKLSQTEAQMSIDPQTWTAVRARMAARRCTDSTSTHSTSAWALAPAGPMTTVSTLAAVRRAASIQKVWPMNAGRSPRT